MKEQMLAAQGVDFSYYDGLVLKGVNLALETGELVALVGPNGSGKTTLLKVLGGLLRPKRGEVSLYRRDLRLLGRREIAQRMALVPQETVMPFAFTAWEMAMLGRTPYARPFFGAKARDEAVVREMMELTETLHLAERPFGELSGGERQRVIIAMALAQEPKVLLLDEPTVHLDISHQMEILELLVRLNRDRGLTVLASMHDLNLAALYFRRLVMMNGGSIVAEGAPQEVLVEERIRKVFGAEVEVRPHPRREVPQITLLPGSK